MEVGGKMFNILPHRLQSGKQFVVLIGNSFSGLLFQPTEQMMRLIIPCKFNEFVELPQS